MGQIKKKKKTVKKKQRKPVVNPLEEKKKRDAEFEDILKRHRPKSRSSYRPKNRTFKLIPHKPI